MKYRNIIRTIAPLCLVLALAAFSYGQEAPAGAPAEEVVQVYLGRSQVVDAPWPTKRVSVTDPAVADVKVLTARQVLVQGRSAGETDLIMWSEQEDMRRMRIVVRADLDRIRQDIETFFPSARLTMTQSQGAVVLRGQVERAEQTEELEQFFEAQGIKVVDMTTLAGPQQVMLRVRVAEVSRSALRAMGFNFFGVGNDFFGGSVIGSSAGPLNPVSIGLPEGTPFAPNLPFTTTADVLVSPAVTLFGGFPRADIQFFIQALAENQYLRVLAEPNLVTLSGAEASFLAGGEFPIPIVQGTTGGSTAITVEYREFGVRLRFRPIVLGNGLIRLHVAPEVSELSDVGAVEIQGFRIPSLLTRRSEATLQLKNGETFAMAGLLSNLTTGRTSRVPILGDVPILGTLFRSVRYQRQDTELAVLVTAHLVEPMAVADMPPTPGILHREPTDWELFLEGRIEGDLPARVSPVDAAWLTSMGLNRLAGPGAWETYNTAPASSEATLRPAPTFSLPARNGKQ